MFKKLILLVGAILQLSPLNSCSQRSEKKISSTNNMETATFGAGCFWCVEAIFQMVDGVIKVESGYSGGTVVNPSYEQVCSGTTGHAEVCQITYDPSKVNFTKLLEAFWTSHDPTTMNRQGNDVGTQYRSVIYYHNEEQKRLAEEYKAKLNASGAFNNPVITEIAPFTVFYKAEGYHQNYYNLNGNQPYCSFVITPKVEKFKKVFKQ
ncbi:MAG: peptide-methionine (S)-S-oxide reductase MsrA [Bacteroidia bacterium]|nr:peptide-methionine (S)-S-oxide reductase MsrA [Bacteroidia bacterium]